MNVLLLSPRPSGLIPAIESGGDEWAVSMGKPDVWPDADFIVSYGYRHKIVEPYLSKYRDRMINIHISILPWNRGADPNLWSWYDDTPKGVSIHFIDSGFDTGPVIGQMNVTQWREKETLASSYHFISECAERLFCYEWDNWRIGSWFILPQLGAGSYHRSIDKEPLMAQLPLKWDTPVGEVERLGEKNRAH